MAKTRIATSGEDQHLRLAVLIDADNAQAAVIDGLLTEIAGFGEATVKRIYGDFTTSASAQWKKVLNRHAIKPVQQFAYTTGKNSTDSTLIIDAMDLLYTRRFDGFCLVSSDSDFTGLALRIREEGLMVLGFGEQKTPESFRNACHRFVFTEVLRPVASRTQRGSGEKAPVERAAAGERAVANRRAGADTPQPETAQPETPTAPPEAEFPREFMLSALEQAGDDTGWASLGAFGTYLNKLQPDFDSRLYGFKKLSDLVKAKPDIFQLKERAVAGSGNRALYVRAK